MIFIVIYETVTRFDQNGYELLLFYILDLIVVTKQKLLSLMVITGMLVATIFPVFHEDQISNNSYNISDITVSTIAQAVYEIDDKHEGEQSENIHCETCHVFYHLYVGDNQLTNERLVRSTKHYSYADVFNGRSAESIKKPPRLFG
ncbi:MAG: hypothetical protein DHS20C07_30370 [Methyloligella sp.]|nr:MAG: hypothetical protein DHS20C07_30370 [Methyloligella sp.]